MTHIVLIAPRFSDTLRYLRGFARTDCVLSVVSLDPQERLPPKLRSRISAHYQVRRALDSEELAGAVRVIARGAGRVDRLVGPFEDQQLSIAKVRDALDIDGVRTDVAQNYRDKNRMKDLLRAHGVPVARSGLAHSLDGLRLFVDCVGFPIIVKPQAGVGARSTYRISSNDELLELARRGVVPTKSVPLQVEQFIRARERTCETVTIRGRVVWHSGTRYLPSPLEVLEAPWKQYCVLLPREEDDQELTRFHPTNAAALAALFGPSAETAAGTALTHMEWFLRSDGSAVVNEVGVRPPGAQIMPLISIAHETDFWSDWAELIAFERFTPKPRRWAAGVAFFRGQGPGTRVAEVQGLEAAVEAVGDALIELRAPTIGKPRMKSYEGDGWATVRASTTAGVERALLAMIQRVRVRYA